MAADFTESQEIPIGRMDDGPIGDGERANLGIRDEISGATARGVEKVDYPSQMIP